MERVIRISDDKVWGFLTPGLKDLTSKQHFPAGCFVFQQLPSCPGHGRYSSLNILSLGLSQNLPFYCTSSSVLIPQVKVKGLERSSHHLAEMIRSAFMRNASLKICKLPFALHKTATLTFHSAVTATSSGTYRPEYTYALVCAHLHTRVHASSGVTLLE